MVAEKEKIVLYTQSNCKMSNEVKKILTALDYKFTEIDVTTDSLNRREMFERSGRHSTPQIIWNNKLMQMGEMRETLALNHRNDSLAKNKAGAKSVNAEEKTKKKNFLTIVENSRKNVTSGRGAAPAA